MGSSMTDVSPKYKPNDIDSIIAASLLKWEGTAYAIVHFSKVCHKLTPYSYWFLLSTLWVSYSGWSDLILWKRLFESDRPGRKESIMKPSEVAAFDVLPDQLTAYRAHRAEERDWISYTLSLEIAKRFARERGVKKVTSYQLRKKDVIALFLRRGEQELLMLDPRKAVKVEDLSISEKR